MVTPSEHWQQNERINAHILAYGPALFEAVRQEVFDKATVPAGPYDRAAHARNQALLTATVARVCAEGRWRPVIGKAEFWDVAWGRIVYQGTRADKASKEIRDMRARIPLFADHAAYDPRAYAFDKHEWERFAFHWKRRFDWYKLVRPLRAAGRELHPDEAAALAGRLDAVPKAIRMRLSAALQALPSAAVAVWGAAPEDWAGLARGVGAGAPEFDDWLAFAKAQGSAWTDSLARFAEPASQALAIMTKSGPYEGIGFSAHAAKMAKYLKLADFLTRLDGDNVLDHFAGADYRHDDAHLGGADYVRGRDAFWQVHARFKTYLGPITSLHLMMDLGFKTVKPDRVLTYLFSQLGWLQTLPATLAQDEVLDAYTDAAVVREVLYRADVLAAALAGDARDTPTHRLLDIWFVKFGQEGEDDFGIETKLEGKDGKGIRTLYQALQQRLGPVAQDAADGLALRWPAPQAWAPVTPPGGASRDRSARVAAPRAPRRSAWIAESKAAALEEAGRRLRAAWIEDAAAPQRRYPPRIDDRPKQQILDLIARGTDAHDALRRILGLSAP